MTGFDQAWLAVANVRDGEPVSPRLRPLLEAVYQEPRPSPRFIEAEKEPRGFASVLESRGPLKCFAQSEAWERDWAELNLPEGLHDVLAMMGEALHDTIQAPEIAKNFGCLPEQLLERLRQLPDSRKAKAED